MRCVALVAAMPVAAGCAGAQSMPGTRVVEPSARRATVGVRADSAWLAISPGAVASVSVRMPSGTFLLEADSASVVRWTDEASALAPVEPVAAGRDAAPLVGVLLFGETRVNAMRLARLPARDARDTLADYRLEASNGAWTGATVLSHDAFRALTDAVHGVGTNASPVPHDSASFALQVDRPVEVLKAAVPAYPYAQAEAGREGRVLIEFEVGPDGRARPQSVRLLDATTPEFARSVHNALPRMRFRPALVAGAPITMIVQQEFQFHSPPRNDPAQAPDVGCARCTDAVRARPRPR